MPVKVAAAASAEASEPAVGHKDGEFLQQVVTMIASTCWIEPLGVRAWVLQHNKTIIFYMKGKLTTIFEKAQICRYFTNLHT